jgi:predicted negative regulator of RcsB-dependent stress response
MSKKIKFLALIIGGVVILAVAIFSWRYYSHQDNSVLDNKSIKTEKETYNYSNDEEDNIARPAETDASQKSGMGSVSYDNNLSSDKSLDEDSEKITVDNNDEDDDETNDSITVEAESDDE